MPSNEDGDHLNQLFPWMIPCHQNYSCIKNFIIIVSDDLILAQRIYRWITILFLYEECVVWMILFLYKEFNHYCFGRFNSCTKNLPLNTFTLAWRIYRWMILLLHEEFIVKWFFSYMNNFIGIVDTAFCTSYKLGYRSPMILKL